MKALTRTTGRSQAANLASARTDLEDRLRRMAARHARQVVDHTTGRRWSLRAWEASARSQ